MIYIFAGLFLLFAGCKKQQTDSAQLKAPREVVVKDLYAVDIPSNLLASNDLHDFANLQYYDHKTNFYIIGLDEPKENLRKLHLKHTLDEYTTFVINRLTADMDSSRMLDTTRIDRQGLEGKVVKFEAVPDLDDNLHVKYKVAVYESATHFYQLIQWSEADQFDKLESSMDEVINSFRELNPSMDTDTLPSEEKKEVS